MGPDVLDLLQWPAMGVTIVAAWFVGSSQSRRRKLGFWLFLVSNVLWIVWGAHTRAYALIVLQFGLAFMNIRGERKNDRQMQASEGAGADAR